MLLLFIKSTVDLILFALLVKSLTYLSFIGFGF